MSADRCPPWQAHTLNVFRVDGPGRGTGSNHPAVLETTGYESVRRLLEHGRDHLCRSYQKGDLNRCRSDHPRAAVLDVLDVDAGIIADECIPTDADVAWWLRMIGADHG